MRAVTVLWVGESWCQSWGIGGAKEEKRALGKVKGHLERRHCLPCLGQRSCLGHGHTEGLNLDFLGSPAPAQSYPCSAVMTHVQEASPADTCLAGSGGQREESSSGLPEPPVSMASVPGKPDRGPMRAPTSVNLAHPKLSCQHLLSTGSQNA